MCLPVLAYICAILAMGLAAIFVPIPLALIGAGLFIASLAASDSGNSMEKLAPPPAALPTRTAMRLPH